MVWSLDFGTLGAAYLGSRDASKSRNQATQLDKENRNWQEAQRSLGQFDTLGRENFKKIGDNRWLTDYEGGSDQLLRDRDFDDFTRTQDKSLGTQQSLDQSRFGLERQARKADFQHLRDQGLTPQEIVGSPIGGGVGGSAPSGQTLGSASATQSALQQQRSDAIAARERSADRANAVRIEAMRNKTALLGSAISANATFRGQDITEMLGLRGQDVQAEGIKVNAETQRRGQDIQEAFQNRSIDANLKIAREKLKLQRDQYQNIELPMAANKIVTTTPEWERHKILAQMGVDNILATSMAGNFGLDPMDPKTLSKFSRSEFRQLVRMIYGYSSKFFGETAGMALSTGEGFQDTGAAIKNSAKRLFKALGGETQKQNNKGYRPPNG